jgi:glycosyltransferase involved in cell wall biosynthesis
MLRPGHHAKRCITAPAPSRFDLCSHLGDFALQTSASQVPRIALFHPAFQAPGGAEFLCAQQARALRAGGDEVKVVTLVYDAARWGNEFQGISVERVKKRSWTDVLRGTSRSSKLRSRARRAARSFSDADVVVAHNAPCNTMLGLATVRQRTVWQCNEPPRVLHRELANPRMERRLATAPPDAPEFATAFWRDALVGRDGEASAKHRAAARFDIEMTARLDHIYAISEFSRDNARNIYGRCGEEVVYPIVRFPEGGLVRKSVDRDHLQVLVHTRLEVLKNVDTVIRGFAQYHARHPGSVLHIVGDGPARNQLATLAAELLAPNACSLHGFLPHDSLRTLYERCDVLALLPLDEPFGMIFPEAAARGLLMIGPDHGGPLEIFEGGRLGACVDPFDPSAVAEALEEVGRLSPSEVTRRRVEADRSCRARFSSSVVVPKLRRILLEST